MLTFSIANSEEYTKTTKSFKILSVETQEVIKAMETTKPCLSTLKVTEPSVSDEDLVTFSSVVGQKDKIQEAETVTCVDLTHFTKDDYVHTFSFEEKAQGVWFGRDHNGKWIIWWWNQFYTTLVKRTI